MAKYKTEFDEKKHKRFLKEGRGQGSGDNYVSWLLIFDIVSSGNSYRLCSAWTHHREVHLFSQLECRWFYIFDWDETIIDIREQYPLLPLEETLQIAEQLGIKHPVDPKTQYPIVMTSDFLLTGQNSDGQIHQFVRTIKYANSLQNERVQEKFMIEQEYWKRHNVGDWQIFTEEELDIWLAKNIELLRGYVTLADRIDIDESLIKAIAIFLTESILSETTYLVDITILCDNEFNLPTGSSLAITYHLIANRVWIVNLHNPIFPRFFYRIESHSLSRFLSNNN